MMSESRRQHYENSGQSHTDEMRYYQELRASLLPDQHKKLVLPSRAAAVYTSEFVLLFLVPHSNEKTNGNVRGWQLFVINF